MATYGVDRYGRPMGYDQQANPYNDQRQNNPAAQHPDQNTQQQNPAAQQGQFHAPQGAAVGPQGAGNIGQGSYNATHQAPQTAAGQLGQHLVQQGQNTGGVWGQPLTNVGNQVLQHYGNTGVTGYAPGGQQAPPVQPQPPQQPAPPQQPNYALPGQYLPGNGSGYDPTKGLEGGNTAKYKMRNVLSHFDPNTGLTPEAVNALNAAGIGHFRMADNDELVLDDQGADPSFGRTRHFDVIPNSADKSIQHTWGYLQQDKGGVMGGAPQAQLAQMMATMQQPQAPTGVPVAPASDPYQSTYQQTPQGSTNLSGQFAPPSGAIYKPGQLPTGQLPEYQAAQMSQFANPNQAGMDTMQNALMAQMFANPHSMTDQGVGQMKQKQMEDAMQMNKLQGDALMQGAASRGAMGGSIDAGQRRLATSLADSVMGGNRDIDIAKMQQDRADELGVLGASNDVLGGQMNRATQGYGATLQGQQAQATQNMAAHDSRAQQVQFDLQRALSQEGMNSQGADSAFNAWQAQNQMGLQNRGLDLDQQRVGNQSAQFNLSNDLANKQFADDMKKWRAMLNFNYQSGAQTANQNGPF